MNRGEQTRQAILDAAEQVFADLGFSTARLEDVAVVVGIRRASLVYYFRGKQELYDEVEKNIFRSLQEATTPSLVAVTDPWERMFRLVDAWFDFMVERPTAARIITRVIADIAPRAGNPVEFSDATLVLLEAIIGEGQAAGLFAPIKPVHFVNTVGASILHYVCSGNLYGRERTYSPADAIEQEQFRDMLHTLARALLTMGQPQP